MSREMQRAVSIGKSIDRIFQQRGINPDLASLAAYELESFTPSQFSEQMAIRRAMALMSRDKLSTKIGYDQDALWRWESGQVSPKLVVANNWAQALGLELMMRVSPL